MRIKKNDQVQIISGKDRGKRGKILRTLPRGDKVVVDGLNLIKKHMRPKRSGEKGQRVEISAPINVSKIMLVCPQCGRLARVGYKIQANNKTRICKKCQAEI